MVKQSYRFRRIACFSDSAPCRLGLSRQREGKSDRNLGLHIAGRYSGLLKCGLHRPLPRFNAFKDLKFPVLKVSIWTIQWTRRGQKPF